MNSLKPIGISRREALRGVACGFGGLAFGAMAHRAAAAANPLAPKLVHHAPKAKRVIFLFMAGGVSHVDSFDYKQKLFDDDGKMVRFDDARAVAGYLGADDELPADATLVRPVAAGELVPAAALGSGQDSGRVELPLSVDPERLPDLGAGMTVDVYLLATGRDADGRRIELDPGPVLADVTVVDASTPDGGFGSSGQRRVVVAVPEDDADAYVALLGRLGEPTVLVSRARRAVPAPPARRCAGRGSRSW